MTRNPILKGVRRRNDRVSKRVNKTGRHRSEKAPESARLRREVPHLAFIERARYDRVLRMIEKRNSKYSRCKDNGHDPRAGVSRKRTRWPGQHIYCGICGRLFVYGGHGQKHHLMCTGAREHVCWNGFTANGPLAARKIADAVLTAIETIPDYDDAFLAMVNEEATRLDFERTRVRAGLEKEATAFERQIDNFMAFIREGDRSQRIRDELERLEVELSRVNSSLRELEDSPTDSIFIPPNSELKQMARQAFGDLALDNPEFGRLMRLLIPKIVVFAFRLCDGKKVVMRAKFRLHLSRLLPEKRTQEALLQPLEQILTVDLFDHPQREKYRQRIAELRQSGATEAEAAAACGITKTAAQNAMRLHRKMQQLGLDDPYVPVTEPPEDSKLSRHKHHRYRFEPLDDAGQV